MTETTTQYSFAIERLTTGQLVLRQVEAKDIPFIVRYAGSDAVHATTLMIPYPYTEQHAIDWMAGHEAAAAGGTGIVWAIVDAASDDLIGAIDIRLNMTHKRAEIGYWIGPAHWGKGYATQAVGALIKYGFETLGLYRIHADHFDGNDASGRVMLKNGMKREGVLRGQFIKDGRPIDSVMYAITRPDYDARS